MGSVVTRNEAQRRYELRVGDELVGTADYREHGCVVVLPHTVVTHCRRGQGFGARLVAGALDDIRASGRSVDPQCWYVARFLAEHDEYADLRP